MTLERYLNTRLRRVAWWFAAVVGCVAGVAAVDRAGWLLYDGGDRGRFHGKAVRVVRVIDGDTLVVESLGGGGQAVRVRLWGVDTPEVANLETGRAAERHADESTRFTEKLCGERVVSLELEPHQTRDKFGRLLAYVRAPGGEVLNEQLILAGLARADGRFSYGCAELYESLEFRARQTRVGMWAKSR